MDLEKIKLFFSKLFDNSNITLDDVPSIQLIEGLGLNVIIALWGLENE